MADLSGLPSFRTSRYLVDPSESAVLIEARSTAGQISFGTTAIRGQMEAAEFDGALLVSPPPAAELEVDLRTLRSGNALYDAELAQRLNVQRYPQAKIVLEGASVIGERYQLSGSVTLHGRTCAMNGSVSAVALDDGWVISGEQVFDIRDFQISVPSVLMIRIFPDVRVHLELRLRPDPVRTGPH